MLKGSVADCSECDPNEVCVNGECQSNPCAHIDCPPGQVCQVDTRGEAQCVGDWTAPVPERDAEPAMMNENEPADAGLMLDGQVFSDSGVPVTPPPSGESGSMVDPEPEAVGCSCDAGGSEERNPWMVFTLLLLAMRRHIRR